LVWQIWWGRGWFSWLDHAWRLQQPWEGQERDESVPLNLEYQQSQASIPKGGWYSFLLKLLYSLYNSVKAKIVWEDFLLALRLNHVFSYTSEDAGWALEHLNETKKGHNGDWEEFSAMYLKRFQGVAEYSTVKGLLANSKKNPLREQTVQEWVSTVRSTLTTLKSIAPNWLDPGLEWYL
jgi:hypothetical protein